MCKPPETIFRIDTGMFDRPGFASVYLVKGEQCCALLDSGVSMTAGTVLEGVAAAGVSLRDLNYICLSHAHYDHAGGAHELIRRLKAAGAQVTVACAEKPSVYLGRQDILDKIMAAGLAEEGERAGIMRPIDPQDLLVLKPGDHLELGGTSIQALDAPGHANGHLVFFVPSQKFIYVGDACGFCGRVSDPSPVIVPTAFAPEYRHRTYIDTVRSISGLGARSIGFAHFGFLADPRSALLAAMETAEWMHTLVQEMVRGGRSRDGIVALMNERLSGSLMPLYRTPERVRLTIEALILGMVHDLERSSHVTL